MDQSQQRQVEHDWLRERVRLLGAIDFSKPELGGRAANAMVDYALGGELPPESSFPKSTRELTAALNVIETAPEHLRERMQEAVDLYRERTGLEAEPGKQEPIPVSDFVKMLEQGEYVAEADMLPTGDYDEKNDLLAEWQWLRERARLVGAAFPRDENVKRSWGRSSNDLVEYALGGPYPSVVPLDGSDLAACEEAVRLAPQHLRARMEPVVAEFRVAVEARYAQDSPEL